MKSINRYSAKIALVFMAVLILASCSDLLDQKPQGQWTSNDQKGSYESQVFTLYGLMRGFNVTSGTPPLAIHNMRSEDVEKGSTQGDGADVGAMFDNFEYSASNGLIAAYWEGNYKVIHKVNDLVFDLKQEEEKTGELSDFNKKLKAEGLFFRAFTYFNLVRAFGEVPLIDFKLDQAEDANVPKSSVEQIYELIDADLTYAAAHLPLQWGSVYTGRLTAGAAKALHARTYMMRSDWDNMYKLSKEVIDSGIYNLSTPFNEIFREKGENSPESVFEIQCTATDAQPESSEVGSQYAQIQGVRGSGDWNLGWGWHTPTEELAGAFEAGDPRKDETLLYFAKNAEEAAVMKPNAPYNEVPIAQNDVVNKYYNKKVYTDPELRSKYTKSGFWVNIRIIRYADVLLMAAEAANELGKPAEAADLLEQVRARARGERADTLPRITVTNQVDLRERIRHERRVELAMEWDRFYDLVRWGIASEVLHAAGKTSYQPKHALLPIPQSEIDKSNGVLVQNPNY